MKTDRQIIEEKGNEYGLAHLTDLMNESKETIIEFIDVWLVNRFGRVDRYYREEWLNRFKKYGYCAFLFHMDGNSLFEWNKISKNDTKAKFGRDKKTGKFPCDVIPSTYYTLYIDWNKDGNFSPEFGDWFKYIVKQEQKDSYEGETFKIIETMEVNNG